MSISKTDGTQRASIDSANPNTISDELRKIAFGSLLQGQIPQVRRRLNPVALGTVGYCLNTLHAVQLPDGGAACTIVRATSRAGGVTGELTPVAYGTTPTTGQIAVAPNGDIVVLAADAITDLDVVYLPDRGDIVQAVFPVVSNAVAIPASYTAKGVVLLLEAESIEGTLTGKLRILVPGGSATTGLAALNVAKNSVSLAAADAIVRVRLKLMVLAAEDLCSILEATATTL
jgi:hypothetical protein